MTKYGEQYPKGWTAPNKGRCLVCDYPTMAHDKRWLRYCPYHWQQPLPKRRGDRIILESEQAA